MISQRKLRENIADGFTPDIIKKSKTERRKQKWSKKTSVTAASITTILFIILELSIRSVVSNTLGNTHGLIGFIITNKELSIGILIVSAFIGMFIAWIAIPEIPAETDDSGNIIDDTNIYGGGRKLSQKDKARFLEVSSVSDPKGLVFAIDKTQGKALGLPIVQRTFKDRIANWNMLIFGSSGEGKTNLLEVLVNQAIKYKLSIFVLDPKLEYKIKKHALLLLMGYKNIWQLGLNFDDLDKSDGLDILKFVRNSNHPTAVASRMSEILWFSMDKPGGGSAYWNDSVRYLLSAVMVFVAKCKGFVPSKNYDSSKELKDFVSSGRTWIEVIRILRMRGDEIYKYIKTAIAPYPEDIALMEKAGLEKWREDDNYTQISDSLIKQLGALQEDAVAELLSRDEIDFEKAITDRSFLSLAFDVPNPYFRPAMSLVINLYLDEDRRLSKKSVDAMPLRNIMILEELKVAGKIPGLGDYLSIVRSWGTALVLCAQSYPQLVEEFGQDEVDGFFQNVSVFAVNGQEERTAKKLEFLTSRYGAKEKTHSESIGPNGRTINSQTKTVPRPVISAQDILDMEKGEIFIKPLNVRASIENAYIADDHPYASAGFVKKGTGEPYKLTPEDTGPAWSPEDMGLEPVWLSGPDPHSNKTQTSEVRDEDAYI